MKTSKEDEKKPPIVTHVTEVKISLLPEAGILRKPPGNEQIAADAVRDAGSHMTEHLGRVASMMDLLAGHGFTFRADKNAVYGYSSDVEAGSAKRLLQTAGFKDREFQIFLEYTRGWGMM